MKKEGGKMDQQPVEKEMSIKKVDATVAYSRNCLLGKGVFGDVYLGFFQPRNQPAAVKVISFQKLSANLSHQTLITKIKDEIVNMQIARNPHIVEFFAAKSSTRNIYIVAEYCRGWNLETYIHQKGLLTEPQALNFFKHIIRGFQQLTQKHIVHRDLKPANLLLDHYSVKIADLGLSKCVQEGKLLQSAVGSPNYMSPQIFARQKYSSKTDVWSLGVILFEMLYGHTPWPARTLKELTEQVRGHVPSFPDFPYVSPHTTSLLTRMLQVQEVNRLDWNDLFAQYLQEPPISQTPIAQLTHCLFLQSHLQLPSVLAQINPQSAASLRQLSFSPQLFSLQYYLLKQNALIKTHYNRYLAPRNQITFLFHLYTELCKLQIQIPTILLSSICTYTQTVLCNLVSHNNLLYPPLLKWIPYDSLLLFLLNHHRKVISFILLNQHSALIEHSQINSFVDAQTDNLFKSQVVSDLTQAKQSMIVVLKKIYNEIREWVVERQTQMISENEPERNDKKICTALRMIYAYVEGSLSFVPEPGKKDLLRLLSEWNYPFDTPDMVHFKNNLKNHFYNLQEIHYQPKNWLKDIFIKNTFPKYS